MRRGGGCCCVHNATQPAKQALGFVKLLEVRHRASLQVDQMGMSPVFLTFVAQSGRGSAFIICTRTEDDNWDERQETLRPLTTVPRL